MTRRSDDRYEMLRRSVFAALPESELRRLSGEVQESRLLANHLLYDPEVTVVAAGVVRAYIADGTAHQVTVAYLRAGATLALAHLAGRRYPTAFQAVTDTRLLVVGNERTLQLQRTHADLGMATAGELSARLDDLEIALASFAFGSLRQRLAFHLLALTDHDDSLAEPVHLTHLASAVGSSRVMVSRNLRPLADDGILRIGPAGVTIADSRRLRDHANVG